MSRIFVGRSSGRCYLIDCPALRLLLFILAAHVSEIWLVVNLALSYMIRIEFSFPREKLCHLDTSYLMLQFGTNRVNWKCNIYCSNSLENRLQWFFFKFRFTTYTNLHQYHDPIPFYAF